MDFGFTEEQRLLRDTVRKLMDRHAPRDYVRRLEKEAAYPYEVYDAWVEAGLFALPFPAEYGGLGGSVIDMAIVVEEIAKTSADFVMAFSGSIFCGLNLLRKASPEQTAYWLPRITAGEIRMSISMSEPDAGSDMGAMRTVAVRDGANYIINGQKLWATGAAARNNVINLYCKTDTKVPYKKGMSLFLVDADTPGIEMRKLDLLGRRCTGTYEIFFRDVVVPAERLVGGEGGGWDCVLAGLQAERVFSAAGSVGAAQAIYDYARNYARERRQFGQAIGGFQAIGHMLADMETEIEAARGLLWRAAWLVSEGQPALREITMAKLFAGETYVKAAATGMQIMGGYGYNKEFDMERHFRDSRIATIAAGSSQMQRNLLANLAGLKAG